MRPRAQRRRGQWVAALTFFAANCIGHGDAAPMRDDGKLHIAWDGATLHINNDSEPGLFVPRARVKQVDCAFDGMRTKCWRKYKRIGTEPYGKNLMFVRPVAVLPQPIAPQSNDEVDDGAATYDWSIHGDEPAFVGRLPPLQLATLSESELQTITESDNGEEGPGPDSMSHKMSPVSSTIGGPYALSVWQSLAGRVPVRKDCYGTLLDYCSAVTRTKLRGEDALAYCDVVSTPLGLGFPFNCFLVALKHRGIWYVYAYDSPEQCDGCGFGGGASCTMDTTVPLEQIATSFVAAFYRSKAHIKLQQEARSPSSVRLLGKKIAADSRFFKGYYERASATYEISDSADLAGRHVDISGFYYLLVSAEPSSASVDYREVRDGDLEWLQRQVFKIVRGTFPGPRFKNVSCDFVSL